MDDADAATLSFDDIYRLERPKLVRVAYLIVRSQHVAEELVHDGFLRLHQNIDTVDSPGGFLHTAVVRLCLTWLKRRDMERDRLRRLPADEEGSTASGGRGSAGADVVEDADELWAALAGLDPDRRTVLVLRFYEDLPYEQIAEIVECPIGTVRSRLHRGLADLRKELSR